MFILNTKGTTYCFEITKSGHLEHLYYGKKIHPDAAALREKDYVAPGNTITYDSSIKEMTLEYKRLEFSSYGKGDIREPFIEVINPDGSLTSDFLFKDAVISKGKPDLEILPSSYDEKGDTEHLCVILKDEGYNLTLELHYYVFEDCDVITRNARFINDSKETVILKRLLSTQLDFISDKLSFTTFNGAWANEMNKNTATVNGGKIINSSNIGASSNRSNPFVMIHAVDAAEDYGKCYGINLIYSGNHYECFERTSHSLYRFVSGINPCGFSFEITPGSDFVSPESVMTFSDKGFNGMSLNMHEFVREHIVRGNWKKKERPVLLNSWEACYFDLNEKKMLKLAKEAKDVGAELFVMDDGWFGNRDDDTKALGDWDENLKKLPGGLSGLGRKIKALGLDFGIWVEPEMVNTCSSLYYLHPDWTLEIPSHKHSEGRNQRVLDLSKSEVCDFIIEKMSSVFSSAEISYVKWDMNRIFSDAYSQGFDKNRQQEIPHRYMLGLYRVMKTLTERFPDILFEGCASGGNRFDLGILCYFPQIWASDNTDASCRAAIQTGYSYGYPQSTISAHVSNCPNHQTLRNTSIETRFNIAAFGILGYELNLCDISDAEKEAIAAQIAVYKANRALLQFGHFYRGAINENEFEWTVADADSNRAVGLKFIRLKRANDGLKYYHARGLLENARYHFTNRVTPINVKIFGDLVNSIAPVHVKQGSIMHDVVSRIVKFSTEKDDGYFYGDMLMEAGYLMKQDFVGTGFTEGMRVFTDFGSAMYFIEREDV